MPSIALNQVIPMDGFMTQALFLRGQPSSEVERRLGYAVGRLSGGWWLLFLEQLPTAADFEFMGYSQMSGGIPQGHLNPAGGLTAEQDLVKNGYDVAALKTRVIAETFKIGGPHRLAKVIPLSAASGPMPYPPGEGIPQWKLVKKLRFRAAAQVGPGGMYSGDYR